MKASWIVLIQSVISNLILGFKISTLCIRYKIPLNFFSTRTLTTQCLTFESSILFIDLKNSKIYATVLKTGILQYKGHFPASITILRFWWVRPKHPFVYHAAILKYFMMVIFVSSSLTHSLVEDSLLILVTIPNSNSYVHWFRSIFLPR